MKQDRIYMYHDDQLKLAGNHTFVVDQLTDDGIISESRVCRQSTTDQLDPKKC